MDTTTITFQVFSLCRKGVLFSMIFCLFSLANINAQRSPKEGMKIKEKNFISFTQPQKKNLDMWRTVNEERYYNHPDFGVLPDNAPCTECVEDLSKREKDLRHFIDINDTRRFYTQKGNGLLHYKENGFWKTIDYKIKPSTIHGVYKSDFYLNKVMLNNTNKKTEIVTNTGSLELNQWTLYKSINGSEQLVSEANWSNFTVGDDGMFIKNIFNDIDAELIIYPGGIKTNFIIKKNTDFGNYDALIFRDNLSHSNQQPVQLDFKNHSTSNSEVDEIIVTSNGQTIAEFQEAVAFASNGSKETKQNLKYVLNENKVDVIVPAQWIETYKANYDLIIDPQVTGSNSLAQAAITGSEYNASCNFDNSCDQFLTVPAPANATLDDVLWSFTYEAIGDCWLEDGAVRFTTGTCLSPSQAGFFWFCNQTGGGTCAGENISVYNDLGGCLPGPSCTTQNVDFTMQFFRRCWGAAGCNNTCIGAFSPWTMTITGQTIEYTNVTNPITMSALQVCEGASLTASTSGQNGVPPYTYNWSFDPSGTPSVGTGSSANITFPTAGTETLYSIITDDCGNQSTASVNITVTPSPTPVISGDTDYCEGQTAAISTGAFSSYDWSNGATTQNTTVTDADNPITVTVTDANGCIGTSAPFNVTENPNPTPVITGDTEYCEGQTAAISTGTFSNYDWSNSATTQNTTVTDADNPITVTVTDANGCIGTSAPYSVTENPSPTPTISGATSYCAGSSANISAPAGFTDYNWSNGATSQSTSVTDADNPVTVTVTDANGCSGTSPVFNVTEETTINYAETIEICQGQSATIHGNTETTAGLYEETFTTINGCDSIASITLVVNALPTITASASETAICDSETSTISATGGDTYTWDNGLGAGQNHTVTPNNTTIYEVIGTDVNGCENTDQIEITVNPNPTVEAGVDITECEGETITLTGSGTATSYSWNNGVTDGVGFTQPVGTVTYTVIGVDANGCENTDEVDVTIESEPTVSAGTNFSVCEGEPITLTGSGTATSYTWDNDVIDGVSFTQPVGTVTYTVTGTSGSNCSASDQVQVTVNPNPSVNAGTDQSICAGDEVTLTATGADSYNWDNGVTNGVPFTPGSTTIYTVTGEDSNGCTATDEVTVTVNPIPTVGAGVDQTICEGEEIMLSGTGADSYTWDNDVVDGNLFAPSSTTTYTVTGEDANGCINTATVTITVTTQPNADFTATPNTGQSPLEVEFTNNSNNGTSYNWDFGNGDTESSNTITDQIVIYTEPGEYEVWLTVTNGDCVDEMSAIIIVQDLPLSYVIPNIFTPNNDGSNDLLHMNLQNAASFEMEIFNRWGNRVGVVDSVDPEDGWDGRDINTGSPVSEGVYFYKYKIVDLNGEEIEGHSFVHLKL